MSLQSVPLPGYSQVLTVISKEYYKRFYLSVILLSDAKNLDLCAIKQMKTDHKLRIFHRLIYI